MKHTIIILVVALLSSAASGQTNAVDPQVEQLRERIEDQIKRGPSVPIALTPEEDALLVKEGVLPPLDQKTQGIPADAPPVQRTVQATPPLLPSITGEERSIIIKSVQTVGAADQGNWHYTLSTSPTRPPEQHTLQPRFDGSSFIIVGTAFKTDTIRPSELEAVCEMPHPGDIRLFALTIPPVAVASASQIPPDLKKVDWMSPSGMVCTDTAKHIYYLIFEIPMKTKGVTLRFAKDRSPTTQGTVPGKTAVQQSSSRVPVTEQPKPANWPAFSIALGGDNPVRVRNPNPFDVKVGLRSGENGRDFDVPANGTNTVFVSDGPYEIYFHYSNDPDGLYQGDSFRLSNNGVELQIVKVVDGNYGIRKIK